MTEKHASLEHLEAKQLAHKAWGTTVDIAEILRSETMLSINMFLHNLQMHEELAHRGESMKDLMENMRNGVDDYLWPSTASTLYKNTVRNLLRNIPLDEFIDKDARDFLRHYALDETKTGQAAIEECDTQEYDFWYGMLHEGREIIATADGCMRLYEGAMKKAGVTYKQLHRDDEKAREVMDIFNDERMIVCEHAVRTSIAEDLSYRNLLERDRLLNSIRHTIDKAAQKLFTLLRQEERRQG